MPTRPTHRFIATYKGKLAGVVVMATPNSFSNLLGKEKRHLEKLISRGACISWSPKNLASSLVMFAIRWMVKNTEFRFFTAYSDVEARELGTIYQACNFIYLGQNSGARCEYFDPNNPNRGWFSDRQFRKLSQIKRYASELNISWQKNWSNRDKLKRGQMPIEIQSQLKAQAKRHQSRCLRRDLSPKHKYVYILGQSKSETKKLKKLFKELRPELWAKSYPKHRGPQIAAAANFLTLKEEKLTQNPKNCRPHGREDGGFLTVKEAAKMLRVSEWTIYSLIKTDLSFPYVNLGIKKKYVVDESRLGAWMTEKTNKFRQAHLPSGEILLKRRAS